MIQQWRGTTNGRIRGAVVAIGLVVLTLSAWTISGGVPYQGAEEQNVRAVVGVVEQFMAAGKQRDAAAGRQVVSALSPALSAAEITTLFETRRDLFDRYSAVGQEMYGVTLDTNWDGTRALLEGKVSYDGRPATPVRAELIKRNNQWRLTTIRFGPQPAP